MTELQLLQSEAGEGDINAKWRLGNVFLNGLYGAEPNAQEALRWYEAAAMDGHVISQFMAGALYEGCGVRNGLTVDMTRAAYWYEQAANQGMEKAQSKLKEDVIIRGLKDYYASRGYQSDTAEHWFEQHRNVPIYQKMGFDVDANPYNYSLEMELKASFITIMEKEADAGALAAQMYLAKYLIEHLEEHHTVDAGQQIVKRLNQTAEQGCAEAQFSLGECYEKAEGVEHDDQKAAYWYNQAAKRGCQKAIDKFHIQEKCMNLSMYYMGKGKSADNTNADRFDVLRVAQVIKATEATEEGIHSNDSYSRCVAVVNAIGIFRHNKPPAAPAEEVGFAPKAIPLPQA
ncbi:MAG: sel1 repeat family protein [Gammaproteobacteria bacterium]|nr:sel1 repeat family protein [Gammaproteobacteria bacterium]